MKRNDEQLVVMTPADAARLLVMAQRTDPIDISEALTICRLASLIDRIANEAERRSA